MPYAVHRVTNSQELVEFLKHKTLDIPADTPPVFQHVMKVRHQSYYYYLSILSLNSFTFSTKSSNQHLKHNL